MKRKTPARRRSRRTRQHRPKVKASGQKARKATLRRHAGKPITRADARRRAARHVVERLFKGATVADGAKVRLCIYHRGRWKHSDVWVVYKNADNPALLTSADIIAVSKRTGRVVYEGSAGDEG